MFLRTEISPSLYIYGYEIDQVKGIRYLANKSPEWARSYLFFINHIRAMDTIAKELSDSCGLTLHAIPLWVGGGHINYGMTFFDGPVALENRTPEDAGRLAELERLLESMDILMTPKPKLELLCSAACRGYPVEPPEMAEQSPPDSGQNSGRDLALLVQELKERCLRLGQKADKRSQEERGSDNGKRPPARKQRGKSRAELTPKGVDHPRFVLSYRGLIRVILRL